MQRRFRALALLCGLGCLAQGSLDAQENVGTFQVLSIESEGGAPVKIEGTPNVTFATSAGFGIGPGGLDPNNKSALFGLLENDSIRRELKLTPEQQEGAKKIADESNKRMSQMVRESLQAGRSLKDVNLVGMIAEHRKQSEAALEEILLPQQLKRIRQLAYQVEIAKLGMTEALTEGRLSKDIGVTDNQKKHLAEKAAEVEAEARAAIAKIKAAAQAKLFAELSTEQRQAAEELLGEYFLFEEPSMEQRIRQNLKARQAAPPKSP